MIGACIGAWVAFVICRLLDMPMTRWSFMVPALTTIAALISIERRLP